jgi:hypothetical protein
MNTNTRNAVVLVSLVALLGCGPTSRPPIDSSAPSQDNHIALAKQFLASQLGVTWKKDSEQDRETQTPITRQFWATVMGDVMYEDKNSSAADSRYIRVTLSKDLQKYYEDYEFLIDTETKKIVAIKKRKWDG